MSDANIAAQKKVHPLVEDYWMGSDEDEHSTVATHCIADVTRATDAIRTIARLVHNSLSEPEMSGSQPLSATACRDLLCGLEVIGDYIFEATEKMRETASNFRKFAEGAKHG